MGSPFLENAEFIGIERQLRDQELARSRFGLQFSVRHLQGRQKGVEGLFEQFGRNRTKIVVARLDRTDHDADFI